ncbi:MAG: DUF2891 family protein [Planctomycetota bacterium]
MHSRLWGPLGTRLSTRFATLLLPVLLVAQDPVESDSRAAPVPVVDRLVAAMKGCLRVPEPTTNAVRRATGASLFDGSYDWHSNLFAHWALLVHARRSGDEELARGVLAPLTPAALQQERERLAKVSQRRRAVFPYGEGWLLQLLDELEHHREVAASTRAWRREIELEVLAWLEARPFPGIPEQRRKGPFAGRRFLGSYRSWAWNWYQLARSEPIGEGVAARLEKLFADKLMPNAAGMLAERELTVYEFLDVPAIAFLVHDVRPLPQAPKLPEIDTGLPLPDQVTLRDTHSLGKWISRLWPLAIAARTDPAARERLDRELARYLAREDLWNGDFTVIRHWIPQFLWFAIHLAEPK